MVSVHFLKLLVILSINYFQCEGYKHCIEESCRCKTDTGEIFDLAQFKKPVMAETSDYFYIFKPCGELVCSNVPPYTDTATVCQQPTDENDMNIFNCGNVANQKFQVSSTGDVQVVYITGGQSDNQRQSVITLLCDATVIGKPELIFLSKKNSGSLEVYQFNFTSDKLCGGAGKSQVGSIIGITVAIFFALVIVHFI